VGWYLSPDALCDLKAQIGISVPFSGLENLKQMDNPPLQITRTSLLPWLQNHFSIMLLRSAADGKTEIRQSLRRSGQSYAAFGLDFGRKNFGFNATRDRAAEKAFLKVASG
jgi:hypothetical protein